MTWGQAHVFLPEEGDVDEAVSAAMAPYRAGGPEDLPAHMLVFHDLTDRVREMHVATYAFSLPPRGGIVIEGDASHAHLLDTAGIRASMQALGRDRWQVRFSDDIPSLDAFFDAHVRRLVRDPVSGRFGIVVNPLGEWDSWELGKRTFTGDLRVRSGEAYRIGARSWIGGRLVEGDIGAFLADRAEPVPGADVLARGRALAAMLEDGTLDQPLSILLPDDDGTDADRWITTWPRLGPPGGLRILGVADTSDWEAVLSAAYGRHPDARVANVGYHY
jgi:hypothetical protein